jgi:heptosyltransferase I
MEKLLIVRLGSMGDVLHALPGAAALRRAFPSAIIGWAVEERWSELLCASGGKNAGSGCPQKPLIDRLHFINTVTWRKTLFSDEMWKEAWTALSALRAAGYELTVDFQGAWKSAGLGLWSAAPERIGFERPRERPATMFYTRRVLTNVPHVVDQGLDLAAAVTQQDPSPACFPLPCSSEAESWCDAELRRHGLQDFVLFSPGAGWGAKLWPAENYGKVASALAREGLASLINFGPGEEGLACTVEQTSGGAAQPLGCTLGELVALTRRARLFIGGDSGPMHLAAALRVPVVAIFGPTDPSRTGPYGTRSIVLRQAASTTSYTHHDRGDDVLRSIPVGEVVRAALRLLESGGG